MAVRDRAKMRKVISIFIVLTFIFLINSPKPAMAQQLARELFLDFEMSIKQDGEYEDPYIIIKKLDPSSKQIFDAYGINYDEKRGKINFPLLYESREGTYFYYGSDRIYLKDLANELKKNRSACITAPYAEEGHEETRLCYSERIASILTKFDAIYMQKENITIEKPLQLNEGTDGYTEFKKGKLNCKGRCMIGKILNNKLENSAIFATNVKITFGRGDTAEISSKNKNSIIISFSLGEELEKSIIQLENIKQKLKWALPSEKEKLEKQLLEANESIGNAMRNGIMRNIYNFDSVTYYRIFEAPDGTVIYDVAYGKFETYIEENNKKKMEAKFTKESWVELFGKKNGCAIPTKETTWGMSPKEMMNEVKNNIYINIAKANDPNYACEIEIKKENIKVTTYPVLNEELNQVRKMIAEILAGKQVGELTWTKTNTIVERKNTRALLLTNIKEIKDTISI